ncbi:FtsX-like permease family protein [Maribacter algarum]|uniref:FtsX-like permease family protein n=1 Tax=Maribacter algarum (ex Zhang et al. 2020) TaxID=2578118 RepID=A0A5S3PDS0_9FLAO|nr:ABC transporter permease [Maribacter algarum]TMM52130.1 FtsX-like permease family protein [Maribacter algarum]
MFKNYVKIAVRGMVRSRLFTAINLIGLAISMSVGLLIITFVSDLVSYDNFHENKDNIYRVLTSDQKPNEPLFTLASTSVKTGQFIRESLDEVEDVTTLSLGFNGVAEIEDKKLPVQAYWADNSFLNVFTFPLIEGSSISALKDPYSIVLTEKSANKLFGKQNAMGNTIKFGDDIYTVTGILKDIPKLSYLNFEVLVSFSTAEVQFSHTDGNFFNWNNFYGSYTYVLLPEGYDPMTLQSSLDQLSRIENAKLNDRNISLSLQPLTKISIADSISNEIGPTIDSFAIWVLIGLAFVVIVSACFNYTNLSIARALKRSKEVGVRKVIGAKRSQVVTQFIIESVVISLLSLVLAVVLFVFLREQFIALHAYIDQLAVMELSPKLIVSFVCLAIIIGIIAGVFPALFFSKIKVLQVLKGSASLQLFKRVNLRKTLIVVQYVFSLIFITTTVIGYAQYKNFISFDLGFDTENILNIELQGNNGDLLAEKLQRIPAIQDLSRSSIVTSLGRQNRVLLKYNDPNDSSEVLENTVNENYLTLHGHNFLAGSNFKETSGSEVIVNEKLLKRFSIFENDPNEAIGETVIVNGKEHVITGVLEDFHYERAESHIKPTILRFSSMPKGYINAKIITDNVPETLAQIESAWKELDEVRPLEAKLYTDSIEKAFSAVSMLIKIIGFLAFLAICISSLGLLGMVVFTTETRLKEIGIRKVLGAAGGSLVYLLGKSYLILLTIAALLAIPITYIIFDKLILTNIAYPKAIALSELTIGFFAILILAFLMIGSQTIKAVNTNPSKILRDE